MGLGWVSPPFLRLLLCTGSTLYALKHTSDIRVVLYSLDSHPISIKSTTNHTLAWGLEWGVTPIRGDDTSTGNGPVAEMGDIRYEQWSRGRGSECVL